eukprot:scaffold6273_cov376-Prasinococcus_capsulatus_cf.AAC.5
MSAPTGSAGALGPCRDDGGGEGRGRGGVRAGAAAAHPGARCAAAGGAGQARAGGLALLGLQVHQPLLPHDQQAHPAHLPGLPAAQHRRGV